MTQAPFSHITRDEDRYQLKTYAKLDLSIERGEGCWVIDSDGNRFLDLYGGHAVVSTGHCHPKVVEAIRKQAGKLIFYSNVVYNSERARAVRLLLEMAGPPYYQAFLANSGGEANENAIKLARALSGRREILSALGSFHGRNYGCLSATGLEKYSRYLNTPVPDHHILPLEEISGRISDRTAGVLLEPIQSLSGVREVPAETLRDIAEACHGKGALLLLDEVQTGVGRTGRFLYSGLNDVHADVVTLAKGIASGFPAAAVLVTEPVASRVKSGDLGSTFGGGPLACAALAATLDVIREEGLIENAQRQGARLRDGLSRLRAVAEVRGRGLLIGLRFHSRPAREVQVALRSKGILTGTSDDPEILRLLPPLSLSDSEVEFFLDAIGSL